MSANPPTSSNVTRGDMAHTVEEGTAEEGREEHERHALYRHVGTKSVYGLRDAPESALNKPLLK